MIEQKYSEGAVSEAEGKKLLSAYGIRVPLSILLDGEFREPGFSGPYAVKVSDPAILHKTEAGAVRINIPDVAEAEQIFSEMRAAFPRSPVLIEQMIPPGVEIIAGIIRDSQFGLAIMIGLGGIYAELLKERVFRLVPLTKADAVSMIMETKLSRFVEGFRGLRISLDALSDFIVTLSEFAEDHSEDLAGLDLNPVIAAGTDLTVADVKLIFRKWPGTSEEEVK